MFNCHELESSVGSSAELEGTEQIQSLTPQKLASVGRVAARAPSGDPDMEEMVLNYAQRPFARGLIPSWGEVFKLEYLLKKTLLQNVIIQSPLKCH